MSGQIAGSKIDEVRERTDIVELVSRYVSLKRSGVNHLGLCPFHTEKTPSFSVNAARQFFHCFGCGVGGDVFAFLMRMEGLTFPDAVRQLAGQAGIDLEERVETPEEERRRRERDRLLHINELAAGYFHRVLMEEPDGEPARGYLRRRGYGRATAEQFQLGYARERWDDLRDYLIEQGGRPEDIRSLGLIRPGRDDRGDYDLFRGRLMFPIHDLYGRIVAFAGRVLDGSQPKYINSPESPVYHKSRVLFGLYQARQEMRRQREALLVEGYFDQLALVRAGFPQAVATCGTALTAEHADLLKRYVEQVVLLFDQDAAGQQAIFKAMDVLQREGLQSAVIALPSGADPDSFLREQGADELRKRLGQARSAMDLFIATRLAAAGESIERRARAAEEIVAQIAVIDSAFERDLYLQELARRSGIDGAELKRRLSAVQQKGQRSRSPATPPPPEEYPEPVLTPTSAPAPVTEQAPPSWKRSEETLLCLLWHRLLSEADFQAAGGTGLFSHSAAAALVDPLLRALNNADGDEDPAPTGLDPASAALFARIRARDTAEFRDDPERIARDCFADLSREALKRRAQTLIRELIPHAEQNGEDELADQYRHELSQVQARIKCRQR